MTENYALRAVNATFGRFGEAAIYETSLGVQTDIKILRSMEDDVIGIAGTQIISDNSVFEIRASEISLPKKHEKVIHNGTTYIIQSKPRYLDELRLVWLLDCRVL